MNRIHIVGRKNHGKTTLMVELIRELTARGVRVGSIKHSSHVHELDTPGKDSYRQREAGAAPAAVVTDRLLGIFLPVSDESPETRYDRLAPMFARCQIVLVEGDFQSPATKVEVWRQAVGTPCLAQEQGGIAAVVTDDPIQLDLPVWPRKDIRRVADEILRLAGVVADRQTASSR